MELQKTLGIKTGGPSIPFLYSPSMGDISLMLHRAMTLHWIKGFKTGTTRLDRVKVCTYYMPMIFLFLVELRRNLDI